MPKGKLIPIHVSPKDSWTPWATVHLSSFPISLYEEASYTCIEDTQPTSASSGPIPITPHLHPHLPAPTVWTRNLKSVTWNVLQFWMGIFPCLPKLFIHSVWRGHCTTTGRGGSTNGSEGDTDICVVYKRTFFQGGYRVERWCKMMVSEGVFLISTLFSLCIPVLFLEWRVSNSPWK